MSLHNPTVLHSNIGAILASGDALDGFLKTQRIEESVFLDAILEKEGAGYFWEKENGRLLFLMQKFDFIDPRWSWVVERSIKLGRWDVFIAIVKEGRWNYYSAYRENWCHLLFNHLYGLYGVDKFAYIDALVSAIEEEKDLKSVEPPDIEEPIMLGIGEDLWGEDAKERFYRYLEQKRGTQGSRKDNEKVEKGWVRDVDKRKWDEYGRVLGGFLVKNPELFNQKDCAGLTPWMYALGFRGWTVCQEFSTVPEVLLLFLDAFLETVIETVDPFVCNDAGDCFVLYLAFSQHERLWELARENGLLQESVLCVENDSGWSAIKMCSWLKNRSIYEKA